ncbi:hypothetical protein [Arthrobacter cheniae]|nr:hypothetical protein [Arthrobacter cheniae]
MKAEGQSDQAEGDLKQKRAQILGSACKIGGDRRPRLVASLATAWAAMSVLLLANGPVIIAAGLITL